METKKTEQKCFIGNFKFGKHFYALVLGLAFILFGGLYFLVNAENLEIATNLQNAEQTIRRVIITDDGTTDGNTFFDFNGQTNKAIFRGVQPGSIVKKLGLNNLDELIYENGGLLDDGDRAIGNDIYRITGHVSIGTSTMPGGKLNIVSSEIANPELYIEQTTNSAANIRLKNNASMVWSMGVYASGVNEYYYVGSTGSALFRIYNDGTTSIDGDLYIISGHNLDMGNGDINSVDIVTAVAFVMSSDKSLKENIEKIKNPLDKIYSLNGYTFDWKESGQHDVGLIAQEVENVLPELVHVDIGGHKGVQYANMVALLIEGVKELGNKIDMLYNKYLDQQNKLDELEERLEKLEIK